MKQRIAVLLLIMTLTACLPGSGKTPLTTVTVAPTLTLANPQVNVTSVPDPQEKAEAFLNAWMQEDYETMYGNLTRLSQDAITLEEFSGYYDDVAISLTVQRLDYEILSSLTNPTNAQVAYRVTYHSSLIGELQRDMLMNMTLEGGDWEIQYEDGMILPELSGGNRLALDIQVPARGNIYDSEGNAIAAESQAYALGIEPGKVDRGKTLRAELSRLTGLSTEEILDLYIDAGDDWYIPVGDASAQAVEERMQVLSGLGGLIMSPFTGRYYFDQIASQTVGYVQLIPAEEVDEYLRSGYRGDERVGMAGLEKWSESDLMGQRGADLYVVDPQGQIVTRLSQQDSRPAQSLYLTLDRDLQERAQQAIEGFRGAVVVMERDSGRILAIASSPTFNANLFDSNNYNREQMLGVMLGDGENRLLNRATQGIYPLGSVFKVITMAAALESGLYTKDTLYNCGHEFTELPNLTLYDWTFEKEVAASGELNLQEGLMRSCNPYFWHIGLDLYRRDFPTAVADMARAFGLGSETGIGQIAEDEGNIPDATTEGDAVQLAIGQGTMLVTPLQVAAFMAALGNGGTMYRPQIIEKIVSPDDVPSFTFQPETTGSIPMSPENMLILREAMNSVVANSRGTAFKYFLGLDIPVYGKTGTAQNPFGDSHAWFAGYTDYYGSTKPNIAVAVIAENAGEGSEVGAPIFRRVLEIYYEGKPRTLYPWESRMYVTITPTPLYTNTPIPSITPTPGPEDAVETPQP
jgi:penicillin-binding protein 2